jgi:hypothetical protein
VIQELEKYTFSGHDSFQCRQLWLKKGYDFVAEGNNFNQEAAVVKLGVGKNMVASIRFWLKSFNIIDQKDQPTPFGIKMFDDKQGWDPYLEDEGSLWLLHYQLVKTGFATTYTLIFNELRKEKLQFSATNFVSYIKRLSEQFEGIPFNENTLGKDFTVFTNLYKNDPEAKDIEDSFSGVLSELELVRRIGKQKDAPFQIENSDKENLPAAVLLFAILDNPNYGLSVNINNLEYDWNSPGSIFCISRNGLLNKISEIVAEYDFVTFTDQAGIKELQFKSKPNPFEILVKYYER